MGAESAAEKGTDETGTRDVPSRLAHDDIPLLQTATAVADPAAELRAAVGPRRFACILADPPWRFTNRTGKVAPEHRRLSRYGTLDTPAIGALPVAELAATMAHLYLWVPNALLPEGLQVMRAWGFQYKSNLVWHKIR